MLGREEGALKIVENPVGNTLRLPRPCRSRLEIPGGGEITRKDGGVILGDPEVRNIACSFLPREFRLLAASSARIVAVFTGIRSGSGK